MSFLRFGLFSLSVIFLALLIFNAAYLVKIPVIWPDEALGADLSLNILREQRYGTDLLKDTFPGAEQHGYGYPPLFFMVSALWFKIFGFSIYTQRALSLLLSVFFIILFTKFMKSFSPVSLAKPWLALIILSILVILNSDIAFIRVTHLSRPEIQVLVLSFLALYIHSKALSVTNTKRRNLLYFFTGLSLGVSFISHFLTSIFICSLALYSFFNIEKIYKKKEIYFSILGFLIPLILYVITMSNHMQSVINAAMLQFQFKNTSPHWILLVLSSGTLVTKLIYILYFAILRELFFAAITEGKKRDLLILFLLIFSWVLSYLWQTENAFIYVVIFTYLSLAYLIFQCLSSRKKSKLRLYGYIAIAGVLFFLNIYNDFHYVKNFAGPRMDYNEYSKDILELIPDHVSVYMSAAPDPYFGFKSAHRKNVLYEFPVFPISKQDLISLLDKSDYIIINTPFERIAAGDVVFPYIEKNSIEMKSIGADSQYRATVVTLRSRDSRIH